MRKDIYLTAWARLKAVLTIAIASAFLAAGFLPWTTEYVTQIPGSVLYECQPEIQLGAAAFAGFVFAALLYFGGTGHRFVATIVMALIVMGRSCGRGSDGACGVGLFK